MKEINLLLLLTPKTELAYLTIDMNCHQAIERMRAHGFMAIPVISKKGEYVGTITEGDLLWALTENDYDIEALSDININDIVRKEYSKPVKSDVSSKELFNVITNQNFVPVVDDRNILMGIVTRRKVLQALLGSEA